MTTRVITLWRVYVTPLTTSVSTKHLLIEIMFILNAIKSHFKWSYDQQNLTTVVILYEIYETSLSYEMTTRVKSSIYAILLSNSEEKN